MSMRAFAAASLLLIATFALRADERAAAADTWDQAAVTRYLDARMDLWWTKAKTLRTGAGETKCLSCHTAVPYALVRPSLRRVRGESAPTAHEEKMFDIVRQRVAYNAADQPYYDHTADKKVESRGVEPVLNALVLTTRDAGSASGESSALTRAAMNRLWDVQRPDGAWDWFNFGLEPFEAPDAVYHGAALAALAAGSPSGLRASADAKGQAGLEKLRRYLHDGAASQRLFNRAWLLVASARLEGVLSPEEGLVIVRDLEQRQRADGGWSLADLGPWRWTRQDPPFAAPGTTDSTLLAASDGYATGLVVYAMRQAGVAATHPAVVKGQQWLRTHQLAERAGDPAWAPWRAYSLNFDREQGGDKGEPWRRLFMSDLATAFAALALL